MQKQHFATLVDVIQYRADHTPNQLAYKFLVNDNDEELLTYGDMESRIRVIAARLQQSAAPGDRILILHPPGLEYVCSFFACLYGGFIAVPVYPPNTRNIQRLNTIAGDCEPALALGEYDQIKLQNTLDSIPYINTREITESLGDTFRPLNMKPSSLAFLQYTSGSTSDPKGVMLSHDNLVQNSRMIEKAFRHTDELCVVSWLPPYHDMGLIGAVIQPIFVGGFCVLMSPVSFIKRPLRWLRAISDHSHCKQITSGGPNFGYDYCVNRISHDEAAALDLSGWNNAFNGAEPVRWQTLKNFSDKFSVSGFQHDKFFPIYGLAEFTLMATSSEEDRGPVVTSFNKASLEICKVIESNAKANSLNMVACGSPLQGHRLIIVDPETGHEKQPGEVGEIWLGGPSTAQGYWNKPEATEKTFHAYTEANDGPFMRTGDLGFVHENRLYISSRVKDLIVIDGRNHFPQDLELTVESSNQALMEGNGAAFSIDRDDKEKLVVIHEIKRKCLNDVNTQDIFRSILSRISSRHEIRPGAIVLVEPSSIPKTSSGKIQRQLCKQMFLQNQLKVVSQWVQ